jgi:hypothetical protein
VKRVLVLATLLAAALVSACAARGGPSAIFPTQGDRFFVSGYHPYWAGDAWTEYPFDALDELYVFEIEVGAEGTVIDPHGWPDRWSALTAVAADAGVRVTPTVSMHDPLAFKLPGCVRCTFDFQTKRSYRHRLLAAGCCS